MSCMFDCLIEIDWKVELGVGIMRLMIIRINGSGKSEVRNVKNGVFTQVNQHGPC